MIEKRALVAFLAIMLGVSLALSFIETASASSGYALRVTIRSGSHTFYATVCYFHRGVVTLGLPFIPAIDIGPGQEDYRTGHDDDIDRLGGFPTSFDMGYLLDGQTKHVYIGPDPPLQADTWYTLPDPPLQVNATVMVQQVYVPPGVGGVWVPDTPVPSTPYVTLTLAIVPMPVALALYMKHRKREKQKK